MKKVIDFYSIIWLLSVVLFNLIVFVTPEDWGNKFSGSFWVGYIFIMLAFVALFVCTAIALKSDTLTKVFYRFSVISICYIGVGVMLLVGSLSMLIPVFQPWLCIILCSAVLVFNAIAVLKSAVVASVVEEIDEKVATKTAFIRDMTAEADSLSYEATSPELNAEAKKVYEAFRYSDPMDTDALADLNSQISVKFNSFTEAVKGNDLETAKSIGNNLVALIERRNVMCKRYK